MTHVIKSTNTCYTCEEIQIKCLSTHDTSRKIKFSKFQFIPLCYQLLRAWLIRPVVSFVRFIRPFHSSVSFVRSSRVVAILPSSLTRGSDSSPVPMVIFSPFWPLSSSPNQPGHLWRSSGRPPVRFGTIPGSGHQFCRVFQLKYDRELKHVFLVQNAKPEVAFI